MERESEYAGLPRGKQGARGDGVVRVGPLMALPALVRDLGGDPRRIFAGAGFDPAEFADPDLEIPFVTGSKLLARCVTATGCEHLGLLLGERSSPSSLGVAGFMLQAAPVVGAALKGLVAHLDLHDRGAVATLTTNGRKTSFGYLIVLPGVEATEQIYDLSMTVVCKILRSLCGESWHPTEVLLSRRPPQDPRPYEGFFHAPVRFDAEQTAVVFPTQWLKHPVASADPLLHRYLEKVAQGLHADQHATLKSKLHQALRMSLADHKHNATDAASQLGMHVRTLHRRLLKEGTSFRQELENVRFETAKHLLGETGMPASQIAIVLDYADATAFTRAFKRWSGTTPGEWRRFHRKS